MKNRIIIENRSSLDDINALLAAQTVMNGGRISNDGKQYCYYSVMTIGDQRIGVATDLNKRSDRFVVINQD